MINHLKLYSGLSVYFGRDLKTKTHAHHAMEIIFAVDGNLTVYSGKNIKAHGVIIRPDTPHSVTSDGLTISILLFPETELCNEVSALLSGKNIVKLEAPVVGDLKKHFKNYTSKHFNEDSICTLLSQSVGSGHARDISQNQIDFRVTKVIDLIKSSPQKSVPFARLISESGLSESRLLHLFKKETGTTIRKFALWNKLQHAIKLHLAGNNLTKAASLSGFTDAAHFNRVFVSNFGLNPSFMLK